MFLKFLWLAIGGIMFANVGRAQSYPESALLFSRINPGGSARIQGMGGVQTALGADLSSANSNPAGLGMYNRSEAVVSIGIQNTNMTSNYFDKSKSANEANFNLPALGVVFCSRQRNDEGYIGGAFAVTFNRVNSFSQEIKYEGINKYNSLIDRAIEKAWGKTPPSLLYSNGDYYNTIAGMFYRNFLVSDSTEKRTGAYNTNYLSVLGTNPYDKNDIRRQLQKEDVVRSGRQAQLNFSYGGNFNDRFYIGGGIGIAFIKYISNNSYTESDFSFDRSPTFKPVDHFTMNEALTLSGIGVNATVGIIARPIDALQLGLSYATPTSYSITETYEGGVNSKWNNYEYSSTPKKITLNNVSTTTETLEATYSLLTPSRLNGGITLFIKKKGFITGDVQMTDYSGAKFGPAQSGLNFSEDNASIKFNLKRIFNFRVGGEYRLNNYRIRAGYSMMPDPFKEKSFDVDQTTSSYSLGAGYRTPKVTIDAAAILTGGNFVYLPYTLNNPKFSPYVNSKRQNVSIVITATFPLSR